ncbi:helix-turn-helix domain-containing protein [Sphingomonas sp. CCH15-F11]|uniref:helix-turn-helix domain-containing protein n=1 Tax=Sphingomonas sp. CCH15-F11 TaxID=1768785 RepID=UPI0008298693|nr:helix-turn-helix transcriptional regulator [Sphingomonas sp. CCH15-F11]
MPEYIRLLATACDRASQRAVAERLGKSGGYVSRIINRRYAGSYAEAETLIRAAYGADVVDCPLYGEIPLASCVHNRRRKPPFVNAMQHRFASTCPSCAFNADIVGGGRRDAA